MTTRLVVVRYQTWWTVFVYPVLCVAADTHCYLQTIRAELYVRNLPVLASVGVSPLKHRHNLCDQEV